MDQKQYCDVIETANNRGIKAITDSEMIRKILFEYVDKIEAIAYRLEMDSDDLKEAKAELLRKDSVIEKLRGDLTERAKEIEILNQNLNRRKNVSKSRKKTGN